MGTEHYLAHDEVARWRTGYTSENRPESERGFDIDRWTFARKLNHWKELESSLHVAPASSWMQANIEVSAMGSHWKQVRIPHVVDTNTFSPTSTAEARRQLHLDIDDEAPTLLFLATAGLSDRRKGWDLLQVALEIQEAYLRQIQVLIIGPPPAETERMALEGLKIARLVWIGPVASDSHLRLLYCAADAVVIPSREDNLPLVALEAQSCGRPVVAFATGGLPDVIDPHFSGYLATPRDSGDLARGLTHVLAQRDSDRIREHALAYWSPEVVVPRFALLYDQLT
jgi:glycosyltransferase involved in cell wall biosynthesis